MRWIERGAEGEPDDWFRNAPTGRRRSRSPDEIGDNGKKAGGVGVIYIRS
jgi:hypothetical protein